MPVRVTRCSGYGSAGGTILTRSGRVLGRKCVAAVKRNITASAKRSAPTAVAAAGKRPVAPARRNAIQATTITMSGAMVGLLG
jgi:hypothetical protein